MRGFVENRSERVKESMETTAFTSTMDSEIIAEQTLQLITFLNTPSINPLVIMGEREGNYITSPLALALVTQGLQVPGGSTTKRILPPVVRVLLER